MDNNSLEFVIISNDLNKILKKNSYLEFKSSILIYFNRNYGNIGYFHLLLQYYYNENKSFESLKMPMASGTVTKFCNIKNSCIIRIPNDFEKICFKLSIKQNDGQNRSDSISILHFDNKIYFKYFEK